MLCTGVKVIYGETDYGRWGHGWEKERCPATFPPQGTFGLELRGNR